MSSRDFICRLGRRRSPGEAENIAARGFQLAGRRIHPFFGAAVDDYPRAFARECPRDGATNANRAVGNQGELISQLKIHGSDFLVLVRIRMPSCISTQFLN